MVTCSLLFLLSLSMKEAVLRSPGHSTHEEGSEVAMRGSWVRVLLCHLKGSPTLVEIINGQPRVVGLRDSVSEQGGQQESP